MEKYADLEIGLHCRDAEQYQIELHFSRPENEVDDRLVRNGLRFDRERLHTLILDDTAYGKLLGQNLFGIPEVRTFFEKVRAVAQSENISLRIRLFIGQSAPELHSLRWETLRDPQDGTPLLTGEHLLFSRYLSSFDWRPVRLRPQTELRALAVIANPSDVTEFQLAALHVEEELERVKSNLGDIAVTTLASDGNATLQKILAHLREGYDILYLVGHGKFVENEAWLWLEAEDGTSDRVAGIELVTRLRELAQRPRLIVLASCQSAGTGEEARTGDEGILAALGPRLAEAGIPAVIAMQGNVTIKTINEFMPVFFQELQKDGQIDRAMAVARGTVRERPDWWMPTLFMRLKSGRIWYRPGFAEEQGGLERWPALVTSIIDSECTPILGPGLTEFLFGTHQEIAQRWAETCGFPLKPHAREELPQVAQYLAVHQNRKYLVHNILQSLCEEIQRRYQRDLPEELQNISLEKMPQKKIIVALQELMKVVWKRRSEELMEPYRVLAGLPLPIYITTDPSNLLEQALAAESKDPQVEFCRWNPGIEDFPSIYDDEPKYRPDEDRPLVYHLFGYLEEPHSLVLTEDDYFDYLIGISRKKDPLPRVVRSALVDTALLFLGFQLDDWDFRVLFRNVMNLEGRDMRSEHTHVAAQISPEEGRILMPERARRYIEEYFQGADISIYWGSVEDFARELYKQLE